MIYGVVIVTRRPNDYFCIFNGDTRPWCLLRTRSCRYCPTTCKFGGQTGPGLIYGREWTARAHCLPRVIRWSQKKPVHKFCACSLSLFGDCLVFCWWFVCGKSLMWIDLYLMMLRINFNISWELGNIGKVSKIKK